MYKTIFTPFYLARRNMRSRRGRTFLTLLGIILGVAVVLAIQVTNQTTLDSIRQVFDRTAGQANLLIVPVNDIEGTIDQELLAKVEKVPNVQIAAPSIQVNTLLASEADSWQVSFSMTGIAEGSFYQLYGIDPELDPEVRVYILKEGRMPEPDKYEVIIPAKLATKEDLDIGDNLVILTPEGNDWLKIVGFLEDEGVALLNDGKVGFAPLEIAQDLFQRGGELDEIALRTELEISENSAALEELKRSLSARVGEDAVVIYPASRGQLVGQMLATYQLGLTFFSLIAIFVGAFLIYNAFSMTIAERTREIGMLRAVGMNRFQILRMVLAEAIQLSLIGSILGIGAGLCLARGLIKLLGDLFTSQQAAISVTWQSLLLSMSVGIGVTLMAAAIPSIQAAYISPLEALQVRGRSNESVHPLIWISGLVMLIAGWLAIYCVQWPSELVFLVGNIALMCFFLGATLTVTLAAGWLEGLTRPLASFLYKHEGAIGSANVRRSISRTTLTIASLMVALTMIISINSLAYSFETDMGNWIDNALGGDLYVRAAQPMRESFALQLRDVPGVQQVTPARTIIVNAAPGSLQSGDPQKQGSEVNDKFYYEAIDPETYRQIGDMEFAAGQGDPEANWARLEQGKAIFISNVVADRYELHQGDELVLLTRRGEQAFTIAAEVVNFGGQGQVIYGTYHDLHRWFSEQDANRFTISVAPGYSVDTVAQEIEARYQGSHHVSVQTTEVFKENILNLMNQSFRLFDVLSLIGVIIGALGVINTLTMNVIERQREIGGLRSLGMTRGQVIRMVLAEAFSLGIMGGIYGLGAGFVIGHVLIVALNMLVGYDLEYVFTADPFIIGAAIALVVVQIAAVFPARRAAKVNVIEAIKHE